MKVLFSLIVYVVLNSLRCAAPVPATPQHRIPLGGNAWATHGAQISPQGLEQWTRSDQVCTVYFRLNQPGSVQVSLFLKANADSRIQVSIDGKSKTITTRRGDAREYPAGEWSFEEAGYVAVRIQGVEPAQGDYGILSEIGVRGSASTDDLVYVRNNENSNFYWGRRGPSVHLNYQLPEAMEAEWFYSELTIPAQNDVIGSYFMANGFKEGYFGIQVNSPTERRVLFSVWSPFATDDPTSIPESDRIRLLKKGEDVYTGEFGNEGSGGQSYLRYPWRAGTTYRFLVQAVPLEAQTTRYTAYFYAPEEGHWRLIAQFVRPKTSTYLTRLHSFLENFTPETGTQSREAHYANQWIRTPAGTWYELTTARFTGDNTARLNYRKDYAGGLRSGGFFLKNDGHFNDFTPLDQSFTRPATQTPPVIDWNALP